MHALLLVAVLTSPVSPAHVDGFREAKFGMSRSEVLAAVDGSSKSSGTTDAYAMTEIGGREAVATYNFTSADQLYRVVIDFMEQDKHKIVDSFAEVDAAMQEKFGEGEILFAPDEARTDLYRYLVLGGGVLRSWDGDTWKALHTAKNQRGQVRHQIIYADRALVEKANAEYAASQTQDRESIKDDL